MKRLIAAIAVLVVGLSFVSTSSAQEMQAKKRENTKYFMAVYWDFATGKEHDAMQFAQEHFGKATTAAGQEQPIVFVPFTGEWDLVAYFPLPEGPDALSWTLTPSGAKWMQALAAQEGGMDKAMQVFDQWSAMVSRQKSELVMQPASLTDVGGM